MEQFAFENENEDENEKHGLGLVAWILENVERMHLIPCSMLELPEEEACFWRADFTNLMIRYPI